MAELANCLNCDSVYVKNIRNICRNCYEEEEKAFNTVYRFLIQKKNREASIIDIVEATKVEEELIIKFVRENRLLTSQFPKLAYSCKKCGKNITSGNMCKDCSQELLGELDKYEEEKERQSKMDAKTANVYYTYDKHKE